MKFIVSILVTALLGFALPLFSVMPWWAFAVSSFAVGLLIHQRGWKAFLSGFLALFLLWGIHAFIIDTTNEHILSQRIANVLPLGGNTVLLLVLTAFVGGLVSGMAALSGSLARPVFFSNEYVTKTNEEPVEDSVV